MIRKIPKQLVLTLIERTSGSWEHHLGQVSFQQDTIVDLLVHDLHVLGRSFRCWTKALTAVMTDVLGGLGVVRVSDMVVEKVAMVPCKGVLGRHHPVISTTARLGLVTVEPGVLVPEGAPPGRDLPEVHIPHVLSQLHPQVLIVALTLVAPLEFVVEDGVILHPINDVGFLVVCQDQRLQSLGSPLVALARRLLVLVLGGLNVRHGGSI